MLVMAKTSFVDAVMGSKRFETSDLIFPESYHSCFTNQDCSLPFIKSAVRRNGKPALILSAEEQSTLADPLKHTLICKFSTRLPNFELIRKHFESLKLRGPWRLGILDFRHVMIKVELELDYTFLFTKKLHRIENALVKFLKWTADFDFKSEPPIAPVWIKFPGLKLHLFHKQILFSLATIFGKPLKLDHPTFNLSRPSAARVLVEMDISFSYADEIWIGSHDEGYWQEVVFDSKPLYCSKCRIFGHCLENCFITNPQLRQELAYKDKECGINGQDINVLGGESSFQVKENLKLQSPRPILEAGNQHGGNSDCSKFQHGGTSDCSKFQEFPTVPLINDSITQLGEQSNLNFEQTKALPNCCFVPCIQHFPVTGEVESVTGTTTNITGTALPNSCLDSNIQEIHQSAVPVDLKVTTATSSQIQKENSDPQTAVPDELNNNFPTFQLTVLDNTCAEIDKQQNLEIEDSLIDSAAVFSAVKGREIDPNCSTPNTNAAMEVTTQSLLGSDAPYDAALPTKFLKHAPVYNSQPKFTNDFISDQGNTDSDSYETYTGSYREEDMQLNEACKEVLEEWQEEWEFQKSKKKQKGIRELKNLFKDRGNIRIALGSRRSLSGHL